MRLLGFGLLGLFEPIVTEEIVAEWVRNCRAGLGDGRTKVEFTEAQLDAFCESLAPMFSPETVARVCVGRAESPLYPVRLEGDVRMIQMPIGTPGGESRMLDATTIAIKDIGDVHVVEAALRYGCAYLCTSNAKDFPEGLSIAGRVEVVRPQRLLRLLAGPTW